MSKYNFDQLVDRKNTASYKWDVKDNELPMWVADMDFHVLPEVKAAINKRNEIDAYGYCKCPKEYFVAHANWWNRRHHTNIKPEEMVFSSGVVASIDSLFKHLLPKGSNVVTFVPVYHVFFHCIKNNGLHELDSELIYQNGEYHINFDELEILLKQENTSCLLLCNPHNPVGRIFSLDELKKIVALCEKYNVLIVSDEIHCDITEPGTEYNSIFLATDKAIALWSTTKAFNLAGIHTSVIACKDEELLKRIEEGLGQDDIGEPNYFAPYAAIAALEHGEQWNQEMREYVYNNKKYVMDYLKDNLPELHLVDNEATYLLWLDVSAYTNDSEAFGEVLRITTGLFVSPGKQFGKGGETFIRINIATSSDNVKDACKRLSKFVKEYNHLLKVYGCLKDGDTGQDYKEMIGEEILARNAQKN